MCFVWIWEQTALFSLYSTDWLVFITEAESVYCAVRTESLYIIQVMCFVWIWEQTAIISLYSINWLVLITETAYVNCAVRTESLATIPVCHAAIPTPSTYRLSALLQIQHPVQNLSFVTKQHSPNSPLRSTLSSLSKASPYNQTTFTRRTSEHSLGTCRAVAFFLSSPQ